MSDLVVIVPSRGRPEAVAELRQAFRETCTADTTLVAAVDNDDPRADEYGTENVITGSSRTMVEALNKVAVGFAGLGAGLRPFALGFVGDDHRPRTVGFDAEYLAYLRGLGTGIVFGNDLLQRGNLPTQCAMTTDIVRALGYMAPPGLRHLAVDNFWLDLGRRANCIRYLPNVVVEHMHPLAGKAQWTEGHQRVNAPEMYEHDLAEYRRYSAKEMPAAVEKIRALRRVAA